jgi:hypothetical protein
VWWTAVEIWKPYIREYKLKSTKTRVMYDEIHIGGILDMDAHVYHRDLVIFGDVLEHMVKADARLALERAYVGGAWNIAVSVPTIHAPQGEVGGNPYEEHVHHYTYDEMYRMLFEVTEGAGTIYTEKGPTVSVWWWKR